MRNIRFGMKIGILAIAMMAISLPASAAKTSDFKVATVKGVDKAGKAMDYNYRLLRPLKVVPGKRYPLIIFLHGMGERGSDNARHLTHAAKHLPAEFLAKNLCFVLCPQCPRNDLWSRLPLGRNRAAVIRDGLLSAAPTTAMKNAIAAIKKTVATEPIDPDRVTLTGLSMGGFGSWDLAMRRPNWFAAVAPICGGGEPREAARLLGMGVWAVHGGADRIVPALLSRRMAAALKALGHPRSKYTEIPKCGHNSWDTAYGKLGVFKWLLEQRNTLAKGDLGGALALAGENSPLRPDEKIIFLGDTITLNGDGEVGYVTLLRNCVAKEKTLSKVKMQVMAGTGFMSNHLYKEFPKVLAAKPTMVVIYPGTYDAWATPMGRAPDKEHYRKWLAEILEKCRNRQISVVLATPALMGERHTRPNSLDKTLEPYVVINRELAKKYDATLCDLREEFRRVMPIQNPGDQAKGVFTRDMMKMTFRGHRFLADCFGRAIYRAAKARQAKASRTETDKPLAKEIVPQ